MKYDFTRVVRDLKGKEIKVPEGNVEDVGEILTLDGASYLALMFFDPSKPEDGAKKFKAYELYKKIRGATEAELSAEEVTFLKEKIGAFWSPNVVGAAYDLLEGKDVGQVAG